MQQLPERLRDRFHSPCPPRAAQLILTMPPVTSDRVLPETLQASPDSLPPVGPSSTAPCAPAAVTVCDAWIVMVPSFVKRMLAPPHSSRISSGAEILAVAPSKLRLHLPLLSLLSVSCSNSSLLLCLTSYFAVAS